MMMKTKLLAALCAAAIPMLTLAAYPERPVRVIVPFAAGQGSDIATRIVMNEAAKKLGESVVVDNRPGGSAMVAIQAVQHAAPDGYSILGLSSSFLSNGKLQKEPLPYDLNRDFTPILRTVDSAVVLVANTKLPVKTLADVLEMAKRMPSGLPMGSAGVATTMHLSLEVLKARSGAPLIHVPYKGDPPALTDVIGGALPFTFSGFAAALPHIRSGAVRPIAVTTDRRIEVLPDVPTIAESGFPGFEFIGWIGYFVPAGTPTPVVDKLYQVLRATVEDASLKAKMADLGMFVSRNQKPVDFKTYVNESQQKIEDAIKSANISAN